jgi:UDP-perosamine 4-acetyltransferase
MNKSVIVIGAGGHAKVVIEILREMGYQTDFCVGGHDSPDKCMNIPVLKGDEHLYKLRDDGYRLVFPAIGENKLREKLANLSLALGYELVNAISPFSRVSASAIIGKGIAIMSGAIVNAESEIKDLVIINTGASIDHDCCIGTCTHIAPQCALAGNVKIGENAFLGIGTNVIPNINIGDNTIIGAGGVVVSDIPSSVTAVGVPAKILNKGNKYE